MNNVIIFFQTPQNNNFPGSFFDALEYFIFSYQYNPELKLYIFHKRIYIKKRVLELLKHRYELSNFDFLKNIYFNHYFYYKQEFVKKKINKLFFFDLISLQSLQRITPKFYNKIYYITEYTYPEDKYMLKKKNVIYCSEMPFCYTDKRIKLKFFFDIYKKFDNFENNLYVNYPRGDLNEIQELLPQNKHIINKDEKFYPDLHKHFNEYLYIKSPYWFDTHPRLFHECYFYGKKYNYINNLNVKDGSWYRYYDLQENGLKDRIMNKDDWLIQEMINE